MKLAGFVAALVVGLGACAADSAPGANDAKADGDATATASWHVPISGLGGALLSIWGGGPEDVWAVGADAGDGTGALVIRGTTAWQRVDLRPVDPAGGHLWWVFGPDDEAVWVVGEGGRAFRHTRSDQRWERIETGTDATLYGIWGASENELWAVGGYVFPRTGKPTIVRLTPAGGSVVAELPAEVIESGTFFKVWGSAANDVWVVGEQGMVLHWQGTKWLRVDLGAAPRLVTVHGRSAEDVVIVGGASQALILEGNRGIFANRSPGPYPLLSGVHVAADGSAVAVGMLGQVLERARAGADWTPVGGLPVVKDWHAVWRDERGDLWMVGGNLLSAARFDEGLIVRFGPERADGPRGELVELEPVEPSPEVVEEVADAEDTADGDGDGDVGPVDADGDADVNVDVDVDGDADGDADGDVGPVDVDEDADADGDGGPVDADGDVSADADGDVSMDADGDVGSEEAFEIGRLERVTEQFTPFEAGATVDLVHGPQGGFHVEATVRFDWDSDADTLATGVDFAVEVDGVVRASFRSMAYPMPRAGVHRYQSYVMTAIFCDDPPPGNCYVPSFDSAPFDGKAARLLVTLTPPGTTWTRELPVVLRDTF